MADGSTVMSAVAIVVLLACAASALHMRYFARLLARQRLYVKALHRGDFEANSPESERFWKEMPITLEPQDVEDMPDWIAAVNMVATFVAVVLAIWGGIVLMT